MNLSIKNKLLVAFIFVTLMLVIIMSSLTLYFGKTAIFDLYVRQSKEIAAFNANNVDDHLQRIIKKLKLRRSDVDLIANFTALISSSNNKFSTEYLSRKENLNKLLQLAQREDNLSDIILADKNGVIYYASNSSYSWQYLGKTLESTLKINVPLNNSEIFISPIFRDFIKNNNFNIIITAPIIDVDNITYGIMAIELPSDEIYKDLTTGGLGNTTEVLLATILNKQLVVSSPLNNDYTAILKKSIIKDQNAIINNFHQHQYTISADYQSNQALFVWYPISLLDMLVIVKTNTNEIYKNTDKLNKYTLISSSVIILLFTIFIYYLATTISNPLVKLTSILQRFSIDKISNEMPTDLLNKKDEIGILTHAFKESSEHLKKYLNDLSLTQDQLVDAEKMATLGLLVAGVAHEINTPLGAISASASNIQSVYNEITEIMTNVLNNLTLAKVNTMFAILNYSLSQSDIVMSSSEEREAKRNLSDKLASKDIPDFDRVANILAKLGIYKGFEAFIPFLKDANNIEILQMTYNLFSLQKNAIDINNNIKNTSKILYALKSYAHFEHSEHKVKENIKDGLEIVLTLYYNQSKHGIIITRNYQIVPDIFCYPDELNQVWANLIRNAFQAMNYKGHLTIDLYQENNDVVVKITDTGPGIPSNIKEKIFNTFFTTKIKGEGSGLGLTIVKKIIDKHNGRINFESEPGKTTFTVMLPIETESPGKSVSKSK